MAGEVLKTAGLRLKIEGAAQFSQSISKLNAEMKTSAAELSKVTAAYGKNSSASEVLRAKQQNLATQLTNTRQITEQYREILERTEQQYGQNSVEAEKVRTQIAKNEAAEIRLQQALEAVNKQLDVQESGFTKLGESLTTAGNKLTTVGDKMSGIGKTLTTHLTAPLVGLGTVAAKSAIEFESAFTGVRKTVDGTEEQFAALSAGIREMAKELPAGTTEIAAVAEAAGQLGIKVENIQSFTRVMIDLGEATNMSAGEAATALARFANITGMAAADYSRLGSVVVDLGNNFATTESEIVDMGLRLAAAGTQIGLSEAQIMGFSTALSSLGVHAEAGGTAVSKLFVNMQVAAESGGKANEVLDSTGKSLRELQMLADTDAKAFKGMAHELGFTVAELKGFMGTAQDLENYAAIVGMTGDEFSKAFGEDAAALISQFFVGLGSGSESAIVLLDEMGISEVRLRDTLLRLTGAQELFNEALDTGTAAWDENTALTKEAEQRYATLESRLSITKNKLKDVAITFGEQLMPHIQKAAEKVGELAEKFAGLTEEQQGLILKVAGLAAVAGPVLLIGGKLLSGAGKLLESVGSLSTAIGAAGGLGPALAALANPVGITVAAVGGLAAALVATAKNSAQVKAFFDDMHPALRTVLNLLTPLTAVFRTVAEGAEIVKTMQESAIPAVEHFGAGVSEATQKATEGFLNLNLEATRSLTELAVTGAALSEEMREEIGGKIGSLADTAKEGLEKSREAALESLSQLLADTVALTEQEKAEILAGTQEAYDGKRQRIEDAQAEIAAILEQASLEARALSDEEREIITENQRLIATEGVKALTESELEQKVILERMKENAAAVSAEQAALVVQNSLRQKEDVIREAEEQYNRVLAEIIRQRDESGSITAQQADTLIAEAQRQRDESIAAAEEMHTKIVTEAQNQAAEHVDKVNWETGEILSKWEVFKQRMAENWREIKQKATDTWDEMKNTAATKWENIKTTVTGKVDGMKTAVSGKMAEIKTSVTGKWNEITDFLRGIDLLQIGKDIMQGLINGIKSKISALTDTVKGIGNTISSGFKNTFGISSPSKLMAGYGRNILEGLPLGMEKELPEVLRQTARISNRIARSLGTIDAAAYALPAPTARQPVPGVGFGSPAPAQYSYQGGNIIVQQLVVREEADIRKVAEQLYLLEQQGLRGLGVTMG